MSFLFRLSKFITAHIFCEWLDVTELCQLDSSVCNELERNVFLQLIGLETVKFHGLFENVAFDSYLQWLFNRKLFVREINVSKKLTKQTLSWAISCLPHLKTLSVIHDTPNCRNRFINLVTHCRELEDIQLTRCSILTDEVITIISDNCPNLKSVFFPCLNFKQDDVTDASIIALARRCIGLRSVVLNNFAKLTDNSIVAIAENCPNLSELCVANCSNITDTTLLAVAQHCPLLTSLDVSFCNRITSIGLAVISERCPLMVHLLVQLSVHQIKTAMNVNLFSHCVSLDMMANLKTLSFMFYGLSDANLRELLARNTVLTSLTMCGASYYQGRVDPETLLLIATQWRQLTHIDFTSCHFITDEVVEAITLQCKDLTVLKLNGCRVLTPKVLSIIATNCGSSLRELHCSGVFNSSRHPPAVLIPVFAQCLALRVLDISYNWSYSQLHPQLMTAHIRQLVSLTRIDVSWHRYWFNSYKNRELDLLAVFVALAGRRVEVVSDSPRMTVD